MRNRVALCDLASHLTSGSGSGAGAAIVEIIATKPTFDLQSSVTGLERPVGKSVQPLSVLNGLPLCSENCRSPMAAFWKPNSKVSPTRQRSFITGSSVPNPVSHSSINRRTKQSLDSRHLSVATAMGYQKRNHSAIH
jgi:hypothetical protein